MGNCSSCPVKDFKPVFSLKVNTGHVYVDAPQADVLRALDRYLAQDGMEPHALAPDDHPAAMKAIRDVEERLFWVSPRLGAWCGVFEFRYYGLEPDRLAYIDELVGESISNDLGARVLNMELIGGRGVWGFRLLESGRETAEGQHEEAPGKAVLPSLEAFVREHGLANCGIGYENIPGYPARAIDGIPQLGDYIEGLDRFVHRAYRATAQRRAQNEIMRKHLEDAEAGVTPR
ncbi:MAG: hypothetical protein HY608_11385 [Planctomycetes bacterium]|nr:hypothetical protein [Planctomycetota bacterium]